MQRPAALPTRQALWGYDRRLPRTVLTDSDSAFITKWVLGFRRFSGAIR
jgi:hypothetical protein